MSTPRRMVGVTLAASALLLGWLPTAPARANEPGDSPIPVLAYYYIWYEDASWDRAKIDYPLLGRYSSDDAEVMRQHVRWARDAGIDGFIVSWKSTLVLDRRLEQLIQIANEESFKLVIMYQGLDFQRNPLPVDRIASDIDYFIEHYAGEPAFDLFDGPMLIWSGTWEYSPDEVNLVAESRKRSSCEWSATITGRCVLLLASERNVEGIQRLAGIVDGNAYYWSSVNPDTFPGYQEKLDAMRDEVKRTGGLWIAPAAPGFDARLVGGETIVERQEGATLRHQLDAAYRSSPDAIGIISWNEFSENSQVEPSRLYGSVALDVVADALSGRPPEIGDMDSSQPDPGVFSRPQDEMLSRLIAVGLLIGLLVGSGIVISRRRGPPRVAADALIGGSMPTTRVDSDQQRRFPRHRRGA